jgi:hypothetical protein
LERSSTIFMIALYPPMPGHDEPFDERRRVSVKNDTRQRLTPKSADRRA